jgi:hypothetical protein
MAWSGRAADAPFEGVWQQFEGGWLFWDGQTCFTLYANGHYVICTMDRP